MKKIMLGLCLIGMTFMASAAQISWGILNIPNIDGASSIGATAYLIDAGISGYDLDAMSATLGKGELALLNGASTAGALTSSASTTKGGSNGESRIMGASFDLTSKGTYNYYLVVLNSSDSPTHYLITGITTLYQEGDSDNSITFGNAGQLGYKWNSLSSGGGDVPEPTSGLLLLVGGALLALRRKQK